MRTKVVVKWFYLKVLLLGIGTISSCIEEISPAFVDFEDLLVVQATLTDKLKHQNIYLSRTFEFEGGLNPLAGAEISLCNSEGHKFKFIDMQNGIYTSENEFAAKEGVEYQLLITTQNGSIYESSKEVLPERNPLDSVSIKVITNDLGEEGVAILANSFDADGSPKNYRYEYEETYKIIAPKWRPKTLVPIEGTRCAMEESPDTEYKEVCFKQNKSVNILQTSTKDLSEDRVDQFMVRFIPTDNYIISHRYSILVRQYVQSDQSFNFYKVLNELSSSESVFSENQPGFIQGNIANTYDRSEKVIGFFDINSESEKRVFFNYSDLFPDRGLPQYVDRCVEIAPPFASSSEGCVLRVFMEEGLVSYVTKNDGDIDGGPFVVVPIVCGDCRELGSEEVPEFWVE